MINGRSVSFGTDGWFYVREPNNGRCGISFRFTTTSGLLWRHVFTDKPDKAILAAFNFQAKENGHSKARIDGNTIIYPNLGDDFYSRRLELGWQHTNEEIARFIELLGNFWPHQVVLAIKLSDLVVDNTGRVLCVDWKRVMVGEQKVLKAFSTQEKYLEYIIGCLQTSLTDFLRKHSNDINQIQKHLEDACGIPHAEPPRIYCVERETI